MNLSWQKITLVSALSLVLLAPLQSVSACTRNNHVRPTDVASDAVNKFFEEKNYKKLDELYAEYSKKNAATPDGISSLSMFFKGISQSFNACAREKAAEEEWLAHQASLQAWIQSAPKSTAAKLALALFTIDYGWHGRGNGYGSTVDDAARQLFESRMSSAKRQLDELAKISKNNPAWYAGMLEIGLAQEFTPEEMDALYEKAIRLDAYYIDIYYQISQYYSKYWYGSDEQMHNVIVKAADVTKPRLGQTMYTRLHWILSNASPMFTTGGVSWEKMKTGFEDYLNIYPDNYTRNHYAVFACMAEDIVSLKQQLDQLGDKVNPQAWRNKHDYAYCTALAKNIESGKKPRCFKFTGTDDVVCD